jgi:dUTP pyrophosphatase
MVNTLNLMHISFSLPLQKHKAKQKSKHKMQVKIKKLTPDAVIPSYAQAGDAGLDLTAIRISESAENPYIECGTGLAIEIPEGYVGLVFARSSISKKKLVLANGVGVIDSGYRGEIMLRFKKWTDPAEAKTTEKSKKDLEKETFVPGERVGQLIIIPHPTIELKEVAELSNTERGAGGYGSTGV